MHELCIKTGASEKDCSKLIEVLDWQVLNFFISKKKTFFTYIHVLDRNSESKVGVFLRRRGLKRGMEMFSPRLFRK